MKRLLIVLAGAAAACQTSDYFIANKGPWDRLQDDAPFVGTMKKPG